MLAAPLRKVTLRLDSSDLAYVRFAFSPLWECVAAFRAWMDPSRHALLLPWMTKIKPVASRVDWEPLSSLALVRRGTIPDFLAPPPSSPLPRLSDELANLRRVPAEVVRAETEIAYPDGIPHKLQAAMKKPSAFLARAADLLEEFWRRAVAPEWGLLRSTLESEVLFRARVLALGGPEELFKGMHRDLRYEDEQLTVQTDSYWDGKKRNRGLLLVPSIFSWPDVFLTVRPPWQPTITYTSRGVADLWSDTNHPTPEGLKRLIGVSCARVMARLQKPQTTTEIGAALNLSNAAASEQITKLWHAGILERTRIGRRVFYSLNESGTTMFTAFHQQGNKLRTTTVPRTATNGQ
jgi:uncharacterized protein DUF5937